MKVIRGKRIDASCKAYKWKTGIEMAQPSVAREPSMEEILASIRRIIESNEPGPSGAFSGQLPPVYDDEDEEALEISAYGEASPADIHAERRHEQASPPAHVPPPANQAYGEARQANEAFHGADNNQIADKPQSLADIATRVRAAADRNAAVGPQGYAAPPQAVMEPVRHPSSYAAYEASQRLTELRAVPPVSSPVETAAPVAETPAVAEPAEVQAHLNPANWDRMELRGALVPDENDAVAPVVNAAEVEEPLSAEAEISDTTGLSLNLISSAAGEQIARSFNELADVFNGVERRSIEEMAEEMLRPMLQDWLEDNLPTLVERLVREEIERVARGPRR
jgi:cell pole-organizing protein PopZ